MKHNNNSYVVEDSKQRTLEVNQQPASPINRKNNFKNVTKMKKTTTTSCKDLLPVQTTNMAEELPLANIGNSSCIAPQQEQVKGHVMLIRYEDSDPIELIPLEKICENVQKREDALYSDGVWEITRGIRPIAQLGVLRPSVIHKQEFCIVMRATEPTTMEQMISSMTNARDTPEQRDWVCNCEVSLLSEQQAAKLDNYAKSFDDEGAELMWSEALEQTDSEDDALECFYMDMVEQSAACQCRWANFFASREQWYMAATLMAWAAEDNYNPAVERIKAIEW